MKHDSDDLDYYAIWENREGAIHVEIHGEIPIRAYRITTFVWRKGELRVVHPDAFLSAESLLKLIHRNKLEPTHRYLGLIPPVRRRKK